jgi:hypothetical protein
MASNHPERPNGSKSRARGRHVTARRGAAPLLYAGPRVEAPRALMGRCWSGPGPTPCGPGPVPAWHASAQAGAAGTQGAAGSSTLPSPPPAAVVLLSSVPPAPSPLLSDMPAHQALRPGPRRRERRRPMLDGVVGTGPAAGPHYYKIFYNIIWC